MKSTLFIAAVAAFTGLTMLPRSASAQFDLVGLYHDKVKGFEAIYYLEDDETWGRDRRIFEAFGTANLLKREDESYYGRELLHWNAGLLINVKPDDGKVQFTMFSMMNQLRFLVNDVTEMLHGGRVTVSNILEVSLGGYWLLENTRDDYTNGQGSVFFEANIPALFTKSSYVLGKNLDGNSGNEQLLRFDLRVNYDQLRFLDDVEAKVVRYRFRDRDNVLAVFKFDRLGTNDFRFLSGEVAYSTTENSLALLKGGLDLRFQSDDDFNATRRGHFGTNFGLQGFVTYSSPLGFRRFRPRQSVADFDSPVLGAEAALSFQVPAKWVWTALVVVGSAVSAAQYQREGNYRRAREMMDLGADVLKSTIDKPEDELFIRFTAQYTYNDPTVLEMFPEFDNQHRVLFKMGLMY